MGKRIGAGDVVWLETSAAMGIDVGLDSFEALSDGTEIDNPRQLGRGGWPGQKRGSNRRR